MPLVSILKQYAPLPNYNSILLISMIGMSVAHGADEYEPNDTREIAVTINLNSEQVHSLSPAGDVDWFKFTLSSPSAVNLFTNAQSQYDDTVLTVFDSESTRIANNDDINYSYDSRLTWGCYSLLPAGTYLARVKEYGHPYETIEEYKLSLEVDPCVFDSDEDFILDDWELEKGLDSSDANDAGQDPDNDGLVNLVEYLVGTDPQSSDSNGDGMSDSLFGYSCNIVNSPSGAYRRWGINHFTIGAFLGLEVKSLFSTRQNRRIQSVTCGQDQRSILFSMKDHPSGDFELYELNLDNDELVKITDNESDDVDVTRSENGQVVAWQSRNTDNLQVIQLRTAQDDGSFEYKILASENPFVQPSVSPNGKWLVFIQLRQNVYSVVRYDVTNEEYVEVSYVPQSIKLYHPSISNDGNLVGWSEGFSKRRYQVHDVRADVTTNVFSRKPGVEHGVLSGDGKHVIFSVNSNYRADTHIVSLDTLEQATVGDTVYSPKKYMASNWSPLTVIDTAGFRRSELVDQSLTSLSQSKLFTFSADNTGIISTLESDEVGFEWELRHGVLIISKEGSLTDTILVKLVSENNLLTALSVEKNETTISSRVINRFQFE